MKKIVIGALMLAGVLSLGCAPETKMIDMQNDTGKAVLALDYRDFETAASKMVQSMFDAGTLKKPGGGRYVIATGRIINDTTQRIDTDQLMVKIETDILNSKLAVMTSAVGPESDKLLQNTRDLRTSDEFDPNTVAAKKTLIAPDMTIAGKIYQRTIQYSRNTQQIEYYFQLQLNDVKSGIRFWQDEVVVGKRGSDKSVPF